MSKILCTVGILTFNSEKYIRRALESVKDFDDILICDGGSTDSTIAIAREYGARVIEQDVQFKNANGSLRDYSGVRNQCLDHANHSWFLYIDSDEAASPLLVEEIRTETMADSTNIAYRIPERMILADVMILHSSNYPGYQYRLLRADKETTFKKTVHERPFFKDVHPCIGTLTGPWYVFWTTSEINTYGSRVRKYIELESERAKEMSVAHYLVSFVPRNIKFMAGIGLRTLRNRICYPAHTCMPLSIEVGRIRYHLDLMTSIGRRVVTRDL